MQYRSLFGDIDLFAAKHGLDSLFQRGLFGELKQQLKSLVSHTILGVIEIQAGTLDGHPFRTLPIFGKQLSQMDRLDAFVMRFECFPRLALVRARFHFGFDCCFHLPAPFIRPSTTRSSKKSHPTAPAMTSQTIWLLHPAVAPPKHRRQCQPERTAPVLLRSHRRPPAATRLIRCEPQELSMWPQAWCSP